MSSFTKLIAPGVRTGFMIGEPALIKQLAKVAEDTYISPATSRRASPSSGAAADCCCPQIERLKKLYAPRLDACLAGLDTYMPDAVPTRPEGGFFISLTLPDGVLTTAVRAQASARGLNLADGMAFFPKAAASGSCGCRSARSRRPRSTRECGVWQRASSSAVAGASMV